MEGGRRKGKGNGKKERGRERGRDREEQVKGRVRKGGPERDRQGGEGGKVNN